MNFRQWKIQYLQKQNAWLEDQCTQISSLNHNYKSVIGSPQQLLQNLFQTNEDLKEKIEQRKKKLKQIQYVQQQFSEFFNENQQFLETMLYTIGEKCSYINNKIMISESSLQTIEKQPNKYKHKIDPLDNQVCYDFVIVQKDDIETIIEGYEMYPKFLQIYEEKKKKLLILMKNNKSFESLRTTVDEDKNRKKYQQQTTNNIFQNIILTLRKKQYINDQLQKKVNNLKKINKSILEKCQNIQNAQIQITLMNAKFASQMNKKDKIDISLSCFCRGKSRFSANMLNYADIDQKNIGKQNIRLLNTQGWDDFFIEQ